MAHVIRPVNPDPNLDPFASRLKPSLVDFLHARIDSDESVAREELHVEPRSFLGRQWHDVMRHMLRECDAKRRIVELHGREHECSVYENGEVDNCHFCIDVDECSTLRCLADVYADHPDYREEWKP